jgi:hypothetical protein
MYPFSQPFTMGLKLTGLLTSNPTDKITSYASLFDTEVSGNYQTYFYTTVSGSRSSSYVTNYNTTFYTYIYSQFYTSGDRQTYYDTVSQQMTSHQTSEPDGSVFMTDYLTSVLQQTSRLTGGDPVQTGITTAVPYQVPTGRYTSVIVYYSTSFLTSRETFGSGTTQTSVNTSKTTLDSTSYNTWRYTGWV